jgi:hypothetical protein
VEENRQIEKSTEVTTNVKQTDRFGDQRTTILYQQAEEASSARNNNGIYITILFFVNYPHCCITIVTRLFTLRLQGLSGITQEKLFYNFAH